MNIYILLESPTQLQKFWVNYLRGDNTFILNLGIGDENKTFDNIPEEHKSNCKQISLGEHVYPINKEFFNYILKRPKDKQRYVTEFQNPENHKDFFLVHDPQLEIIKKITYKKFTWFFNSEPYNEIESDQTLLDELHCMPTGFKANWILTKSYTKKTMIFLTNLKKFKYQEMQYVGLVMFSFTQYSF